MSRENYKKQVAAVAEEVINAISQPYGSVPYEKSDGTKGKYTSTDDIEAINEYVNNNFEWSDKKKRKRTRYVYGDAYALGETDGRNVSLNRQIDSI